MIFLSSCAGKRHYEWINIKPFVKQQENLADLNTVKRVNLTVEWVEKNSYTYPTITDSSAGNFQSFISASQNKEQVRISKSPTLQNESQFQDSMVSALNNALVLPAKPKTSSPGEDSEKKTSGRFWFSENTIPQKIAVGAGLLLTALSAILLIRFLRR